MRQTKREQMAASYKEEIDKFLGRGGRVADLILPEQSATEPPEVDSVPIESTPSTPPTPSTEPIKRTSSKQRKADLEEYKEQFLRTPKIVDRQPVFVSRDVRDLLYDIVRRMGERRMSVSGFLENLSRHHLDSYAEELERWRRL